MDSSIIQTIAVYALPVLFAITLHEAAHGYVARMYGDNTAMYAGRITLNPIKHIDPVGTILVPIAILVSSSLMGIGAFLFGWAKPVPVNFGNLRNPKKDIRFVAFAGPGANFVMALLWALSLKLQFVTGLNEPFFCRNGQSGHCGEPGFGCFEPSANFAAGWWPNSVQLPAQFCSLQFQPHRALWHDRAHCTPDVGYLAHVHPAHC